MTIENVYALLAAYGAGFYYAVGAGSLVLIGVTIVQFYGPTYAGKALVDRLSCHDACPSCGAILKIIILASTNVTSPHRLLDFLCTALAGGAIFNGAGDTILIGVPSVFTTPMQTYAVSPLMQNF